MFEDISMSTALFLLLGLVLGFALCLVFICERYALVPFDDFGICTQEHDGKVYRFVEVKKSDIVG
jgi:hypothetical protein